MNQEHSDIKGIIESLIFISEKPLPKEEIMQVIEGVDKQIIETLVAELRKEHEEKNSGLRIAEIAGGYQMTTSPKFSSYLKKYYKIKHAENLGEVVI